MAEIHQEIDTRMLFSGGREADSPLVKVVYSDYHMSEQDETMLKIQNYDRKEAVYLSLDTLIAIVEWAQKKG